MNLAPVVLFVYNRLLHTEQTIKALMKNDLASQSDLIIYSDGFKNNSDVENVLRVRNYLQTIDGFKSVKMVIRNTNYGLGNNIIDGVSSVVQEYGKVIVLEDDLLTSRYFLKYMNDGLKKYETVKNVISVHSYIYPIRKKLPETFFIKGADCLGWATWKDRWDMFERDGSKLLDVLEKKNLSAEFDFNNSYSFTQMLKDQIEGKNTSWAVRWYASAFINNMLTLYPVRALVYHNGNDGSGTNFGISSVLDVKLSETPIEIQDIPIEESQLGRKSIELYFRYNNASFFCILCLRIKKFIISIIRNN